MPVCMPSRAVVAGTARRAGSERASVLESRPPSLAACGWVVGMRPGWKEGDPTERPGCMQPAHASANRFADCDELRWRDPQRAAAAIRNPAPDRTGGHRSLDRWSAGRAWRWWCLATPDFTMPEQSTRLSPDRSTGIPWPHDGAPAVPVVPAASTAVEVDFTPHNPIACAFRGEGFPGFPSQLGAPPLGQYWRSPDNTRQHQEMLMHAMTQMQQRIRKAVSVSFSARATQEAASSPSKWQMFVSSLLPWPVLSCNFPPQLPSSHRTFES